MKSGCLLLIILAGLWLFSLSYIFAGEEDRTICVVIDGFNPDGSSSTETYGEARTQELIQKMAELLQLPDGCEHPTAPNQIVQVQYYGSKPPAYYTAADIADVKAVGRGTPRYALITAKFIKHRLAISGATRASLAGGSYGGLISRYLIEHNVEGLAGRGLIARWLSVEGAVNGALPANLATDPDIRSFMIDLLGLDISDPLTMHYAWVSKHLNHPPDETQSPYFKSILIGHQISTNDDLNGQAITLSVNQPNDGVLLVADMAFHNIAPASRFHDRLPARVFSDTTHLSVKKDPSLQLNIASFVRGKKRVTIRLVQGRALKFKEDEFLDGRGEVVYQGAVHSPFAAKAWGITKEQSLLKRQYHTAPLVRCYAGETKEINALLFDWMINPEEESLDVRLWAEEVDWDDRYKIEEDPTNPSEDLGATALAVPVRIPGKTTYQVTTPKWELELEVEVDDYGF